MEAFEQVLLKEQPDLVVVVGDKLHHRLRAGCQKLSIPVAHIEAGLRSFDREMPRK